MSDEELFGFLQEATTEQLLDELSSRYDTMIFGFYTRVEEAKEHYRVLFRGSGIIASGLNKRLGDHLNRENAISEIEAGLKPQDED